MREDEAIKCACVCVYQDYTGMCIHIQATERTWIGSGANASRLSVLPVVREVLRPHDCIIVNAAAPSCINERTLHHYSHTEMMMMMIGTYSFIGWHSPWLQQIPPRNKSDVAHVLI